MNLKSAPVTILLGLVGLALIAAAGWVALIGPAVGAISEADEAKAAAEDRNTTMSIQLSRLRQQAENLPTTTVLADGLDAMFPPTADQPGFYSQVRDAATQAGLAPEDVTAVTLVAPQFLDAEGEPITEETDPEAAEKPSGDVAVQIVGIGAKGTYDELATLISGLESMDRAFLITAVDEVVEDEETSDELTVTITGTTFVAKPLGKAPSGER